MKFVTDGCHNVANLAKNIFMMCGLPARFKLKTGLTFWTQ